jgi:deoxyribose-phosphate aldolase
MDKALIDTPQAARIALACLDLTSLNAADSAADIDTLCARAQGPHGPVAAVCVWPRFVAQARALLPATIRVAAVANFPDGALDAERAVREAGAITDAGGDEVDLVLPYRAFIAGQRSACAALVADVRRATAGRTLKLIIESGELQDAALIRAACELGLDEGVDFLKTSTGKTPVSATPLAARTMLEAIALHAQAHARSAHVGFKASGGVRRVEDAAVYIGLTRQHLGAAALSPARLRFGASGLLADIEAVLFAKPGDANAAPTGGY